MAYDTIKKETQEATGRAAEEKAMKDQDRSVKQRPVIVESLDEVDPNGIDQHAPGAKVDAGKIFADDIMSQFAHALWAVCELGTFGATKYSLGGWQHVEDGERRYANARMRHQLKKWQGQEIDPDSNVTELTAVAWNALAQLELELRRQENE